MEPSSARLTKIANVLETYYSDASLVWDKVMLNKILKNPEGMVPIAELCKLPKFKTLTCTPEEIRQAAESHSLTRLKFSEDRESIGRIKPYVVNKKEELDDWSIYVEGLSKPYNNEQSIKELFDSLVGHVSFFRIPPNMKGETSFFGFCFLEFDDKRDVEKAVALVNRYNRSEDVDEPKTEEEKKQKSLIDKLNLRVMSKLEWNRLRDEYVQLLKERKEHATHLWEEYNKTKEEDTEMQENEEEEEEKPYTEGIIVFVDGLHPQAPKTVAGNLLKRSGVNIAFINQKKKGLTSTHIRLNTPEDAVEICKYFDTHPTIQETEKDATGKEVEEKTSNCVRLRVLTGTEEAIYWENDRSQR